MEIDLQTPPLIEVVRIPENCFVFVARMNGSGDHFDLVCGQGRLEAYKQLGQVKIPAIVVEATEEETERVRSCLERLGVLVAA